MPGLRAAAMTAKYHRDGSGGGQTLAPATVKNGAMDRPIAPHVISIGFSQNRWLIAS
jgi:hypothetical protein